MACKVLEIYAEPLILGNLFVMESLKDIAGRKMMEKLNIDHMAKSFWSENVTEQRDFWMMAKIPSNVTFENRKKKQRRN